MAQPRLNKRFHGNNIDVDHLVWIDVETTGLIAHDGNLLLEIAVLVTDLDLNVLDENGYQSVIYWPDTRIAQARAQAVPYVQQMHDKTGLWVKACDPSQAQPVTDVDAEVLAYIRQFIPEPRTARLAGNSVRLDLNFADEFLPQTAGHLHYRMYDVSSIDLFVKRHHAVPVYDKETAHTAMSDIRESIAQARMLDQLVAAN